MLKNPSVKVFLSSCLIFKAIMLSSCFSGKEETLQIKFSLDSTAIIFSGLDEVSIFRAKQQADSSTKDLISVTERNGDEAGQEKSVDGEIIIKGNDVVFVPKTTFLKGKQYLVETILNSSFGKTTDILKSDVGRTIKRQQKILQR